MPQDLSSLLLETIERELPHLRALADDRASVHPNGPPSWSPKQERHHIDHLLGREFVTAYPSA